MLKRIAILLLTMLCLSALAFSETLVTATLPADTTDITSFTQEAAFSAEKAGYQTLGWLVEAADTAGFDAFITKYRDSLAAQGFTLVKEVRPAGLNAVYYFFDHPDARLAAARMNGIDFDLFLCGETSGSRMAMVMGVVPGIDLVESAPAEVWTSFFGEEEVWGSVLDELPTGHTIPSFEALAQEAILSTETVDGRAVHTLKLANLSAFTEYVTLLENYGLSGVDSSEPEYGLPLYFWLEDCDEEIEPQKETVTLFTGETGSFAGYVFFTLNETDGQAEVGVWYAKGVSAKDTGERWSEASLNAAVVLDMRLAFAEARMAVRATPTATPTPCSPAPTKTAAPIAVITATPKPASSSGGERCSTCGGDGYRDERCSRCGGDGDVDSRCANCGGDGDRDCMSCSGKGYDNCSGCYGSGDRRCGACYGTGKDGDKRCYSCGGDGEKSCSSCSGTGKKRCSACSGTGDRDCTYCGGDGTKDQSCSSCGGDGRTTSLCSSCGGDGKR